MPAGVRAAEGGRGGAWVEGGERYMEGGAWVEGGGRYMEGGGWVEGGSGCEVGARRVVRAVRAACGGRAAACLRAARRGSLGRASVPAGPCASASRAAPRASLRERRSCAEMRLRRCGAG